MEKSTFLVLIDVMYSIFMYIMYFEYKISINIKQVGIYLYLSKYQRLQ